MGVHIAHLVVNHIKDRECFEVRQRWHLDLRPNPAPLWAHDQALALRDYIDTGIETVNGQRVNHCTCR